MTTPIEEVEELRLRFLREIEVFFTENEIKSIDFEPVENDLEIDPITLTDQGILTSVDEFGNDYDEKLNTLPIQTVALILNLIHNRNYEIN